MNKPRILKIGLIMLLLSNTMVFAEDENEVGFELTTDFFGKYIWRGQNLSDDPVFQPGLNISYGGLSAGVWGNMDLSSINGNAGDFSEMDYSLDYSSNIPDFEVLGYSVGAIFYDFPGTKVNDTTEIYWSFNLDVLLNPSITVYHDVDEAEGSYVSLALGHRFDKIVELGPEMPIGMEIGTSLGWGSGSYDKYYWGTDQSKMQDLAFSVSFPMEIIGISVSPSLNYIMLVSDDIRATDAYGTDSDFFFAGVSLSKSF